MPENESRNHYETRQERREKKLRKQREHIKKHGKSLAQVYRNAVTKRLKNS